MAWVSAFPEMDASSRHTRDWSHSWLKLPSRGIATVATARQPGVSGRLAAAWSTELRMGCSRLAVAVYPERDDGWYGAGDEAKVAARTEWTRSRSSTDFSFHSGASKLTATWRRCGTAIGSLPPLLMAAKVGEPSHVLKTFDRVPSRCGAQSAGCPTGTSQVCEEGKMLRHAGCGHSEFASSLG